MSRSGYSYDCDDTLVHGRWIAQVMSASRGQRGQKLFRDLLVALDEMPEKKLIANSLKTESGQFCTLGVLGDKRGVDLKDIDPEDIQLVASIFDIAEQLAREIFYMNDEYYEYNSPEDRWIKMRAWIQKQIKEVK